MLSSLVNALNHIALGPETRKVKRYLDEATCDSVSDDLGKVLSPQLSGWREQELLQATFDKYCIEDSSQQKCWDEKCFRKHIRSRYSVAAISDPAIQLLWRSFHFYAYHPFPRDLQYARIDFAAFRRAALLTTFQCDGFLGTRELEWFWRNDTAFFLRASLERIFRSIAVPESMACVESSRQPDDMTSSLSDAMDVLVMVGPQFMHAMPSSEQLETVARKLFAEGPATTRGAVRREEISALISLLLRLKLEKEKWGFFYNLGDVVEASPGDEGFTEALVNSLTCDDGNQTITNELLLRAIDLMPNLQLRFHQLWAVLFQPSVATDEAKPSQAPGIALAPVSGAISLFAPHIEVGNGYHQRIERQDTRIALEEVRNSPDSPNMTMVARLSGGLPHHPSGYIVLVTGEVATKALKAVIGAYLPGPSKTNDARAEYGRRESRGTPSHMLFQLQPTFRLLRWTKSHVPFPDLVRTEEKVSVEASGGNEDLNSFDMPYWVGDPMNEGACLRIDPRNKIATLASGDGRYYEDVKAGGNDGFGRNWHITIQNAQVDIFTVASIQDLRG